MAFSRTSQMVVLLFVPALSIALPWIASDYFVMMCIRIMYFGMLTLSMCFLAGELGVVSLMQASFFGISGYFIAILQTRYQIPFPIAPLVGIGVAVLFAALTGLLVIRVRGIYFLMLTLVLGQLVWALASQWASVTRGDSGITDIYAPVLFGVSTEKSKSAFYFFQLFFFWGVIYFLAALKRSPFGLMLRGVRDSESRMAMLGYSVSLLRYTAFIFAAFVASIGGVFFAYFTGLINPHSVSLTTNVETLLSAILGGIQTLFGAILGTAILKTLDVVLSGITQRYLLIMGVLFLIVIMFAPTGAAGALKRLVDKVASRTSGKGAPVRDAAEDPFHREPK
ncbi:MAG: branched-chain amino acid ABC transporter permease [Deltaproteobacteria bacterium]|nr:branched-chain amino acid ABC transporter permease [Deltaproteobacteria bacterium]